MKITTTLIWTSMMQEVDTFEDLWHSVVPASEFDQDEDVEDMIEEMERAAVKEDLEQDSESDSSGSDCD
jgi:hypothetical protein